MGASTFPVSAREQAIPPAKGRRVPQNTESPIPDNGPIKLALTALMELTSNSRFLAFCSSMAAVIPITSVDAMGVTLKNSLWRFSASFICSLSGYSFFNTGSIE